VVETAVNIETNGNLHLPAPQESKLAAIIVELERMLKTGGGAALETGATTFPSQKQ